jgi:hypothetical protein
MAVFKRLLNRRAASDFEPISLKGLERFSADKTWYEGVGATPMVNLDCVGDLLRSIENKNPLAFFSLYSNHITEYTELWGKPDFTYKGEHNWKSWVLKLSETEQFILMSAKGGGSCFEVAGAQCDQWPPKLSDQATERLCRILFTINTEVAGPKRRKLEAEMAERKNPQKKQQSN